MPVIKTAIFTTFAAMAFASGALSVFAQTASSEPRTIVDGTGVFGKSLVSKLSTDADGRSRKNVHPFVIGYCGWRVRALTSFSLTKYDGMQIGLCKAILDFFDPEIAPVLLSIEKNASSTIRPVDITPVQSKAIQNFVVMKYGMYYVGITEPRVKPDPIAKWKYGVGGNLGELAAYLTLWRRIWTNVKFETKIGSYLAALDDDIKAVPKGVDPAFVLNLRKLNSLGAKTTFTPVERRQVNELLTQTLLSAITLTLVPNMNEPIPTVVGSPLSDSETSAGRRSATDYFENGKALFAKGDYKNAVGDFDQAARLDPVNGMIYFHRARAREKLGLDDEAIRDYDAVILLRASLREAYFNRGTLLLNKKEFKSAIADLNAVVNIDPNYESAIFNRGLAYYNSNNLFAALADFNNVLKLQPKHVNALIMRSYVYCAQGLRMSAIKDQELAMQLGGKVERGCQ